MTDTCSADNAIHLTIIGKGREVDKIQKRLRCAARATDNELHLSFKHTHPQALNIGAKHSVAVTYNNKLLLDGLARTEEIEEFLIKLIKK